jgi:hypothetical protein
LAEIAVSRAKQIAQDVAVEVAAPARPIRQAAYCLATLLVAVMCVTIFVPRLAATELLRFFDPFGDHPPFSYTHLEVEPGDVQVRYGDGLDVTVAVSGPPVDELDLVLRLDADKQGSFREEILPLFSEGVGKWRASVAAVNASGLYYIKAPVTRSRRFKLECLTVPSIEGVKFRVIPPDYTRAAIYDGPLPENGLSGLVGTKVEVRVRSNRPLTSGSLEFTGGDQRQVIAMAPASANETGHEVGGTFTIERSGRFQIKVTDIAGQDSNDPFAGNIIVLKDEAPIVRLLDPIAQSLATPTIELPVVVAADDDYGINSVQLFRSLNDAPLEPVQLNAAEPPARRQEIALTIPLEKLGLKPGDVLKVFARVEDNDPAGAKGAESEVAVVQIVSDEELEQLIRTREGMEQLLSKYQEAQRRLESLNEEAEQLKKQLDKRDPEGALSDDERDSLDKLAKHIAEEAEAIGKSAEHVLPYDVDRALNDELQQLTKRMQEAAEELHKAAEQQPQTAGSGSRKLADVQEKLADEKQELQAEINEPLDKFASIYPLFEDEARFTDLARRQRELADRLASLKEQSRAEDPAARTRMRELEDQQRMNREDLEQLLNDIESHAARVPDDDPQLAQLAESAREFCQGVRNSDASPKMSDAESRLSEFSGKKGHSSATAAAEVLESFLSQCQEMGDQACQSCQGLKFKPGNCAGQSLQQMLSDSGFKRGNKPGKGNRPGMGPMGPGGESGAEPNSLKNVGLYGKMPTKGNPKQSKHKGKDGAPTIGGSYRADDGPQHATRLDPHGMLRASGSSPAVVPARYRSRVERYFQRIADEAESK